jgi:hypothetical protein
MRDQNKKVYVMPELVVYGTMAEITLQVPPGKGPAPLDPRGGLPNSKLPGGTDGLGGIHIS